MQANFLWDEEGRSLEELGVIAAAERVERMWERAPETVRKRFLSPEETVLDLGRMIALMWDEDNQRWEAPSHDEWDEMPRAAQSLWLAQSMLHYLATATALPPS